MKKSKKQIMAENILKHGTNLRRIFNLDVDAVTLCKKLRRLEMEAGKVTLAMCNDSNLDTDDADAQLERILARVDALINFTRAGVPVFINRDPRGYALKIKDEYVRAHCLDIHRDWGGYGILAPDYSE